MMQLSRRNLVTALGTGAAGLSIAPLTALYAKKAHAKHGAGFGPLTARLPTNTGVLPAQYQNVAFLALPKGFEYSVVSITGQTLSDGNPVPGSHDGMAAFKGDRGTIVVVRNHELATGAGVIVADGSKYDPARAGGTTTLVFDHQGDLLEHYGSLAGTERNCAGGPTPWDTWLTCEETFSVGQKRHGYVFEVPSEGFAEPSPIPEMGRFSHEAAAVDPETGWVYLTEDRGDSLLYRFRSNTHGDLRSGGVLEALVLVDWPQGVNTRTGFLSLLGQPLAATWVTIDVPDPNTESGGNSTRSQGQAKGCARFSRGEGAWFADDTVYFVSTDGGEDRGGQVWAYDCRNEALRLIVQAERDLSNPDLADNGGFLLAAPDNITVGPDGRLYLCEDGGGVEKVVGVEENGDLFEVARNVFNDSEFAGACFSPNGQIMFVNTQSPGLTHVIRGPFRKQGQKK